MVNVIKCFSEVIEQQLSIVRHECRELCKKTTTHIYIRVLFFFRLHISIYLYIYIYICMYTLQQNYTLQ